MAFDRWTDCPPRGPVSAPDGNTLGLYDHLFLLLGRVGDFNVKDRKRKLRILASNNGRWRPQPTMHPPMGDKTPEPKGEDIPAAFLPHFFGMAPTGTNASMPSSYNVGKKERLPDSPEAIEDINLATGSAVEDWNTLVDAIDMIEANLGGHYQPVSTDGNVTGHTPFGPNLIYASLDIACSWVLLYSIRIIVNRIHPNLPPHHHVAASLCANANRSLVELIGRACGGISAGQSETGLSIDTGAALIDCCIPLFVAGIQVVVPQQRDWLVATLKRVETQCGFRTARSIMEGCSRCWVAMAKSGRGPPYEPGTD